MWFLPSWLEEDWWDTDHFNSNQSKKVERVSCSSEEMREFVNGGYFSLSNAFYGSSDELVEGSTTVEDWKKEYIMRTQREVK